MEYTKGEWQVFRTGEKIGVECFVLPMASQLIFEPCKMEIANANLIASAPDLYEACKTMVAILWSYGSEAPLGELEKMKRAIAKAEGE